jgi:hypothetical protein
MKRAFVPSFAVATFLIFLLALPVAVLGQGTQSIPDPGVNQYTTGIDTTGTGFNWWWLIPILLLPLIFLAFRKKEDAYYASKGNSQSYAHDISEKELKSDDEEEEQK